MARVLGLGRSYYHTMTRMIERRFLLEDGEKERFLREMRRMEAFSGVRVLTFAVLDTHLHMLLEVYGGESVAEPVVLHYRVRYFSDGLVFGGRNFVQDTFLRYRSHFGLKRRSGPRPIRRTCLDALFTMRDLRANPLGAG